MNSSSSDPLRSVSTSLTDPQTPTRPFDPSSVLPLLPSNRNNHPKSFAKHYCSDAVLRQARDEAHALPRSDIEDDTRTISKSWDTTRWQRLTCSEVWFRQYRSNQQNTQSTSTISLSRMQIYQEAVADCLYNTHAWHMHKESKMSSDHWKSCLHT